MEMRLYRILLQTIKRLNAVVSNNRNSRLIPIVTDKGFMIVFVIALGKISCSVAGSSTYSIFTFKTRDILEIPSALPA